MFRLGETSYLHTIFSANPTHWQRHYISIGHADGPVNGEQNFVNQHLTNMRSWLPQEWFGKYDPSCIGSIQKKFEERIAVAPFFDGNNFYPTFRLIHFANPNNKMSNVESAWLREYWHD